MQQAEQGGAVCERRYRVGEQWYNLRPDALAEYHVGSQPMRFWLEWDRGTMNVRDLSVKFTSYAQYTDSREWARGVSKLPVLICVAPDIAQERRMQRVAQARLAEASGLALWTTTEVLLNEHGEHSRQSDCRVCHNAVKQHSQAVRSDNARSPKRRNGYDTSLRILSPVTLLELAATATGIWLLAPALANVFFNCASSAASTSITSAGARLRRNSLAMMRIGLSTCVKNAL
jgi:Replication-relaxation